MRPYLRAANVTWEGLSLSDVKMMNFSPSEFETFRLHTGDVLLAEASGSPGEVGKPALWRDEIPGCCFQNTLIRVRSRGPFPPFFVYLFKYEATRGAFADASRGVGIRHLGSKAIKEWPVRLPPLAEQCRIVEAIEEQSSRLDTGLASLRRARLNLQRLRVAVLKSAIEGSLVKQDRADEPAEFLLKRASEQRHRLWEEGLPGVRLARTSRYRAPDGPDPDRDDLQELPAGWIWVTWEQVGFAQNGRAFPSADYSADGVRLLRPGNLHASGITNWTEENTRFLPITYMDRHPAYVVTPGELVMNLTAQSLKEEFLGRVCVTDLSGPSLLNQRIARLIPVEVSRRYLLWMFKSSLFRRFVDGLNQGSLIQHMFTSQLNSFAFPLPPLREQERIADEVERLLTHITAMERAIAGSFERGEGLHISILKAAFSGRLGTSDPRDVSAAHLLEKAKSARLGVPNPSVRTGSRKS